MNSSEIDDSRDSSNSSFSKPSSEIPVIDRVPHIMSGSAFKQRRPPRPTLEKPRTTLLLPKTAMGWAKVGVSIVGLVAILAGSLFGVRYFSQSVCEEFGLDRQFISAGALSVNVKPEALIGSFGVKLTRTGANEINSNPESSAAIAALPKALKPMGEYVSIRSCDTLPKVMTFRMTAPSAETELNKLDLYGWDKESLSWNWVGGEIDLGTREIVARVKEVPSALMLVKTSPTQPILGIEMAPRPNGSGGASIPLPPSIEEVNSFGLYLGDRGAITGDRLRLRAPDGTKLMPAIRNWSEGGTVNRRLLRDMLADGTLRNQHVNNLVSLVEVGNYPGVEIDYRGVDAKNREQFVELVNALAKRLNANNKTLTVGVPAPQWSNNKWESTGYDIYAIGKAATLVKLDLSANPSAVSSEQLDSLVNWATANVNRYKLQLVVPTLSVAQDAIGRVALLNYENALAPFTKMVASQNAAQPGATIKLNWKGAIKPTEVVFDEAGQAYRYSYVDARGLQQNVWIGTSASLKRSLERLSVFNTRGVTLRGLDSTGNDDGVAQVVSDFAIHRLDQAKTSQPEVVLTLGSNTVVLRLDQPMQIQTPNEPGNYAIQPIIKGAKSLAIGMVPVQVSKDAAAPQEVIAAKSDTGVAFELGGHAPTLDHAAQMRSSGMTHIRRSVYNFELPTEYIQQAKAAGLKVVIEAIGERAQILNEAYQDRWAQHLAKLAAAGVDAIEVWDEPNYHASWPSGQINGAKYTQLLKKAYEAIKLANPNTLVISGGLVPTDSFGGGCSEQGCDDTAFLAQMSSAGAQNYMDCIGAHFINGASSPNASGGEGKNAYGLRSFAPMRDMYYSAFTGAKPVCFTELGYLTAEGFSGGVPKLFNWASNTTLKNHSQWLGEAAKLSRDSGKVRMLIVWNVDSSLWQPDDPQAGYAIIRGDGTCPACEILRSVMSQ